MSASAESADGVVEAIRAASAGLRPAEARVAAFVVADPMAVIELSVSQLAARTSVSVASVVRCCQSLGFGGYHALKLALARSSSPAERQVLGDVLPDDSAAVVLKKVFGASAVALSETASVVDADVLEAAVEAITGARRVLVAGVGTSAPVAADAAYRFATIGLDVVAPADVHVQHVTARLLHPSDVCVVVSHTGSTVETLTTARAAAEAGAVTIGVTSFRQSPLTEVVDHAIVAGSREMAFRVEAMASRLVHVAVVDALFVLLALRLGPASADALGATATVLGGHRI
jgi:DNA-binding MurR/RpiR family transcriptional regulator